MINSKAKRVNIGRFALVLLMLSIMMVAIPATASAAGIVGTVTDALTGLPISAASVATGGATVSTNGAGVYSIGSPPGLNSVTASMSGYNSKTDNVFVIPGSTATHSFALVPQPGTIKGTVIDVVTSLPISGASVTAGGATVSTNPAGEYIITGIAEGTYTVAASKSGYDSKTITGVVVTPGDTTITNAALVPHKGIIDGIVSDSVTGTTISGATVTASGIGSATTTTDGSGYYKIVDLTEGTYTVTVSKTDYMTKNVPSVSVTPDTTTTKNIALEHNGVAKGKVTDAATSAPVSGATVTVAPGGLTATTDAAGLYNILSISPGTYTATASASGYIPNSVSIAVTSYNTAIGDIVITPKNGTITGKVTDAVTNGPISGATVTAGGITAHTNGAGTYSISIGQGTYTVIASATGYAANTTVGVVITPGSVATVDASLIPNNGNVAGVVSDAGTGAPISGASIAVTLGGVTKATGSTNATGAYSASVAAGTYLVVASASGYDSNSASATVISDSTTIKSIALTHAKANLTGKVTDALTGALISGASVSIVGPTTVIISTNAAGVYSQNVAPGSYNVTVSKTSYQNSVAIGIVVTSLDLVTKDFALVPNNGTITGLVTNAITSAAISGATVTAGGVTTTTNGAGIYSINIAPGTYSVTASKSGYSTSSATVSVISDTNVVKDLSLTLGGTISGTVKNADTSAPIAGATVTAGAATTTTDASGAYSINIAPDPYTVTATAVGYHSNTANVTVVSGSTATANIALVPNAPVAGTIAGTIADSATSAPISGATVTAGGVSATTNATGVYSISIAAGTYTVTASATGYTSNSVAGIVVTSGSIATANVALAPISTPPGGTNTDGKVSGSGTIKSPTKKSVTLSTSGVKIVGGVVSGKLKFTDSKAKITINGKITDLTISGNEAIISGTTTKGDDYTVTIVDNGSPGKGKDKVTIEVPAKSYVASGLLTSGNLVVK